MHDVGRKRTRIKGRDRQAHAIGRNGISHMDVIKNKAGPNGEDAGMCALANRADGSHLFDDASKHLEHLTFDKQVTSKLGDLRVTAFERVLWHVNAKSTNR